MLKIENIHVLVPGSAEVDIAAVLVVSVLMQQ